MNRRFLKRLHEAKTFKEWLESLKRFNYSLVKENGLQGWTLKDYQNYWTKEGRTI